MEQFGQKSKILAEIWADLPKSGQIYQNLGQHFEICMHPEIWTDRQNLEKPGQKIDRILTEAVLARSNFVPFQRLCAGEIIWILQIIPSPSD